MSQTFLALSTRELETVAVDIAWRQWRAIGGSATGGHALKSVVDPEALVLASLFFTDREPRLADVLYSWVERNAPLLSVQRMKNLQRSYPMQTRHRVAAFASKTRSLARHPRWNSLTEDPSNHAVVSLPEVRRAIKLPPRVPTNLLLRLRTAMGVGTKADTLALMLGHERPMTVREITDGVAYTAVAVRGALDDLARAGFILMVAERPASFLAPRRKWQTLLQLKFLPRWVPWHHWYALVVDYIVWARDAAPRKLSDYAIDVKIRRLLTRHKPFFRQASERAPLQLTHGVGSTPELVESLIHWVRLNA